MEARFPMRSPRADRIFCARPILRLTNGHFSLRFLGATIACAFSDCATQTAQPAPAPDLSSSKVNGVPYIAIRSFADERVVDEFDRALAVVRDAPALIIDVRNDNGGDTAVMLPIAGRFLAARRLYAWMARRAGPHLGSRWPEYIDPRGPWRYGGKVIILVDRWSESVAEGFAMALHDARDATVVGTPMAGLGAAVIKKHLPQNDVDAQISAEPVYDATGNPRSDFKPDVLVDLATASGADPILTAGLAAAVPHHAAKL
jgi:carboxyl-terminal processing protease